MIEHADVHLSAMFTSSHTDNTGGTVNLIFSPSKIPERLSIIWK